MQRLDKVFDLLVERHTPDIQRDPGMLQAVERRFGHAFPEDMKKFYLRFDGARLFDVRDPPYRILSLSELRHPSELILGTSFVPEGTEMWVAFCDVRDGNYVAMDLSSVQGTACKVIDCFHESYPDEEYLGTIAGSFLEFVEKALNSDGFLYWL